VKRSNWPTCSEGEELPVMGVGKGGKGARAQDLLEKRKGFLSHTHDHRTPKKLEGKKKVS